MICPLCEKELGDLPLVKWEAGFVHEDCFHEFFKEDNSSGIEKAEIKQGFDSE